MTCMYYFISEHKQNTGRIKFAKKIFKGLFISAKNKFKQLFESSPHECCDNMHVSVEKILAKGQLILKGLFGVFNSSKKMNENKST